MEQMTYDQQEEKIKQLQEKIEQHKIILGHLLPNISGKPFICGVVGDNDEYGLPKMFLVCPTVGLDGFAVYTKTAEYRAPGWWTMLFPIDNPKTKEEAKQELLALAKQYQETFSPEDFQLLVASIQSGEIGSKELLLEHL